jgi:hypothetical protein
MDLTNIFKDVKTSIEQTGFYGNDHLAKTIHYTEQNIWKITDKEGNGIMVKMNRPHTMTIFERDLLYLLFIKRKKPIDYANYFNCQAGKDFMDSINSVKISQKTVTTEWVDYEMHR